MKKFNIWRNDGVLLGFNIFDSVKILDVFYDSGTHGVI